MAKPKFCPPNPTIWRHTANFNGTHAKPGEPQKHMRNLVHFYMPGFNIRIRDLDARTAADGVKEFLKL